MDHKVNPTSFLGDLDRIQTISRGLIQSDQTIISFTDDAYSLRAEYTSGVSNLGTPGEKPFIVPTKQLQQIMSSMKSDKEVSIKENKESIEIVSKNRSYQIPVIWLTDEMKAEAFNLQDTEKGLVSFPKELVIHMSTMIGAQSRMNGKTPLRLLLDIDNEGYLVMIGGLSVVGTLSYEQETATEMSIESNDGILMHALNKLPNLSSDANIMIQEKSLRISDGPVSLLHSATIGKARESTLKVMNIIENKAASTTIEMEISTLLDRIHNAEFIPDKKENISISFKTDKIETKVSTGLLKYNSEFKSENMTMTGEEITLLFPLVIIEPIISSLMEMTSGGKLKINVYPSGDSKIITFESVPAPGMLARYMMRITTGLL